MQIVKLQEMMEQQEMIRSQLGESENGEVSAIESSYKVIIGKYESILAQIVDGKIENDDGSLLQQLGIGVKINSAQHLYN